MEIRTLQPDDSAAIHEAARILTAAFADRQLAPWATHDNALTEVQEALGPDAICRAAFDADGYMLGWIAGAAQYDGHVWELHPLAVRPDAQRRGVGRALVADFERQVAVRGGVTILLGADDEDGMTTLSNVDLYPNVCEHITRVRNLRNHPFEFYQKCGFVIVGVVPDANGPGKPDILMAKRVDRTQPDSS
jgi:aminoglycoside 6'-N-acetyltransferase I